MVSAGSLPSGITATFTSIPFSRAIFQTLSDALKPALSASNAITSLLESLPSKSSCSSDIAVPDVATVLR